MTGLPSIRRRLSLALIGISLVWGIAVSVAVGLVVQHEVDELLDNTLQEAAEILLGLLTFNAAQLPLNGGGAMPAPAHEERMVWQIVGARGELLLRSHRAPQQPLGPSRFSGFSSQGDAWRVFSLPFDATGRTLYVAQRGDERREARLQAVEYSIGAALIVGLAGALWLRSRIRRELEPIGRMSEAVTRFDPLRPGQVLAAPARAELVPMHHAIAGLGGRLAKQVANERAFAAHAAHALRTPLAAMVANLAVAQRRAGPAVQPDLQRTREAADRLRRVVTALLAMFRAGGEVNRQPVSIDALVLQLPFEALSIDCDESAEVTADPDLLAAALMNLFDNSLRHGATLVTVGTYRDATGSGVRVHDNGSGLAEVDRARLQAALDAQDYEGRMGLGLMLADLVARAHGGRLRLVPSTAGCTIDLGLGAAA